MVGQKKKKKKSTSKNNPDIRQVTQKKVHDSEYCNKICGENKCKLYQDYEYRLSIGKVGNGLICNK